MDTLKRCKKVKGFGSTGCATDVKPKKQAAMGAVKVTKSPGGGRGLAKGVSGFHK